MPVLIPWGGFWAPFDFKRAPRRAPKSPEFIKKHRNKIDFQVAFIALRKDGKIGAAAINDGFSYILYNKNSNNSINDISGMNQ